MSSRTSRSVAVLLLTAGFLLLISSQTWVKASFLEENSPTINLSIYGRTLEPLGAGVAWALLAGTIAFRVTSGFLQRVISFILILLSGASMYAAISSHGSKIDAVVNQSLSQTAGRTVVATSSSETGFWLVAFVFSSLAMALAVLLFLTPGSQSKSSRYNRVAKDSVHPAEELTTWQAIDAGIDPTRDQQPES